MSEPTSIVPDKGIRSGLNQTGGTLLKGTLVVLTTGANDDPYRIAVAGAGAGVLGVLMEDVPNLSRGDVQVVGKAIVLASAAVTRGDALASDAAGKAVAAGTGDITIGSSVTTAAALDDLFEVELAGPGGGYIHA